MRTWDDHAVVARTVGLMVLRRLVALLGMGQSPDAKDVEIAVLRHQLAVLHRQVTRPRYTPSDRLVLAWLAKLLPRERWSVFLVTPATLLRWHRELVARRWTYPHTGRGSRGLDPQIVELVLRLARENRRWGYVRIVGEARKLGIRVSATSVRRILRRHGPRRHGGPTWVQFLKAQAAGTLACDFFTVETVGPTPAVRPVRHRGGAAPGVSGWDHRASDGGVGDPGRPEPADGSGRCCTRIPVPRP
jgi:hypothetical protein